MMCASTDLPAIRRHGAAAPDFAGGPTRGVAAMVLLVAGGLLGCPAPTTPAEPWVGDAFSSPQGISASERWILVANTAFTYRDGEPAWEQGFVTFIERASRRVVGRIATTQPNPQEIAVHGALAYVINSGTTRRDPAGLLTVTSGGGIDIIDLAGEVPDRMLANIALGTSGADARIGAYGRSIVVTADGRSAFVGSGTRGDLFEIDLVERRVVRGPDNPIVLFPTPPQSNGMTVVRPWAQGLAIVDFNSDQLCLAADVQDQLAQRQCHRVGVNDELIEGPIDVADDGTGRPLVLMSIANALYRVDAGRDPAAVEHRYAQTGLASNRIVVAGAHAYVVNSLSNNLQRIELGSGQSKLPFAVLPVSSNPYDMVITSEQEGEVAWVTLFRSHEVAVVDLATGALRERIHGAAAAQDGSIAADAGVADAAPLEREAGPSCGDAGVAQIVGIQNVVRASFGSGAGLGQSELPAVIQGGPSGGGAGGGTVSGVLSLGVGGELVVDFGDHDIVDGPGADFIVFENPFVAGPYRSFAEPAIAGVSSTGTADADFIDFPCDLQRTSGDPQQQRWAYPGCAGVQPVHANVATNCIDPTDAAAAGGDPFDLATLQLPRARYLRLRDAGVSKLGEGNKGFDLDAVVLIHYKKR